MFLLMFVLITVSTHSRLKAAGRFLKSLRFASMVSTHSRLKAAGLPPPPELPPLLVSTHSRLKAAGFAFGFQAHQ